MGFGEIQIWLGKLWENCDIVWWKFNRKIEYLSILGNLLLKIEPSEITSISYNKFFPVGGGFEPPNPLGTPLVVWKIANFSENLLRIQKIYRGVESKHWKGKMRTISRTLKKILTYSSAEFWEVVPATSVICIWLFK